MSHTSPAIAKKLVSQRFINMLDSKAPPVVASAAFISLLTSLACLVLGFVLEYTTLYAKTATVLNVLGLILLTFFAALIYGAKLQRMHYRLDK